MCVRKNNLRSIPSYHVKAPFDCYGHLNSKNMSLLNTDGLVILRAGSEPRSVTVVYRFDFFTKYRSQSVSATKVILSVS